MDETKFELILDTGRESAIARLTAAVQAAKNNDQMNEAMLILKFDALHVLATMGYNDIKQNGKSREEVYKYYSDGLKHEINILLDLPEGEMEIAKAGDKKFKPGVVN